VRGFGASDISMPHHRGHRAYVTPGICP